MNDNNNFNYNLSNPVERTRIMIDAMRHIKDADVHVSTPANGPWVFVRGHNSVNPVMDAINTIIWHTSSVDFNGSYISANIGNIGSPDVYVSITTDYGNYIIKKLKSYYFNYDQDKTFARDESAKRNMMEREFNSRFSPAELEDVMVNQSLSILESNRVHSAIENKMEEMLNRYFSGRWTSYTVESRRLDDISVQYTLRVNYDAGSFEIHKPQQ